MFAVLNNVAIVNYLINIYVYILYFEKKYVSDACTNEFDVIS